MLLCLAEWPRQWSKPLTRLCTTTDDSYELSFLPFLCHKLYNLHLLLLYFLLFTFASAVFLYAGPTAVPVLELPFLVDFSCMSRRGGVRQGKCAVFIQDSHLN